MLFQTLAKRHLRTSPVPLPGEIPACGDAPAALRRVRGTQEEVEEGGEGEGEAAEAEADQGDETHQVVWEQGEGEDERRRRRRERLLT